MRRSRNEFNKLPGTQCTLTHTATLPFTRAVLGPMDFKTTVPAEVMGARARQLAMTVVYPSPLLVLCDSPKNYRGQAGIEFLREIPTVWDESVVLSGERWYLAAMSGDDAAQLTAGLNVLGNRRPADYETTRVKSHLSLCFSFLAGFEHN